MTKYTPFKKSIKEKVQGLPIIYHVMSWYKIRKINKYVSGLDPHIWEGHWKSETAQVDMQLDSVEEAEKQLFSYTSNRRDLTDIARGSDKWG